MAFKKKNDLFKPPDTVPLYLTHGPSSPTWGPPISFLYPYLHPKLFTKTDWYTAKIIWVLRKTEVHLRTETSSPFKLCSPSWVACFSQYSQRLRGTAMPTTAYLSTQHCIEPCAHQYCDQIRFQGWKRAFFFVEGTADYFPIPSLLSSLTVSWSLTPPGSSMPNKNQNTSIFEANDDVVLSHEVTGTLPRRISRKVSLEWQGLWCHSRIWSLQWARRTRQ